MPSEVVDLEAHRMVWATARERCRECGAECIGCVHIESDLDRLECAKCGQMTSAVTHFDVDPEGGEYRWQPRLEALEGGA